ncbi:MAG TPA: SUKH-4 family immunity protein [Hyalangium sp.]|nr:SUKH-4 family immunity protein [Hyalangium sp.]
MPKSSDLRSTAFMPSSALAQLTGPGPVTPPEVMKAVIRHVTEKQLWIERGATFRADDALREALRCGGEVHLLELPKLLDAQLKRIPEEMEKLRKKREVEVAAEPWHERWQEGDELEEPCLPFEEEALEGVQLDGQTRSFLLRVGLPESAAPFMDFDAEREGESLAELSEMTGREEDTGLRVLGMYGEGEEDQFICLDERNGCRIVLRNPEKRGTPMLVNSGAPELLECLMVYRDLLGERTEAEEDEPRLPQRLRARAAKMFKAKDPKAFQPGAFWYLEAGDADVGKPAARKPPARKKKPARPRR